MQAERKKTACALERGQGTNEILSCIIVIENSRDFGRSRVAVPLVSIIALGCESSNPFPGHGIPGDRADELRRDEDSWMEAAKLAGGAAGSRPRCRGKSESTAYASVEADDGSAGGSDRAGDILRRQLVGWPGQWSGWLAPVGDHPGDAAGQRHKSRGDHLRGTRPIDLTAGEIHIATSLAIENRSGREVEIRQTSPASGCSRSSPARPT